MKTGWIQWKLEDLDEFNDNVDNSMIMWWIQWKLDEFNDNVANSITVWGIR